MNGENNNVESTIWTPSNILMRIKPRQTIDAEHVTRISETIKAHKTLV
jgi:hypothetical protein